MPISNTPPLVKRINELLAEQNTTANQVANRAGIRQSSLSDILTGRTAKPRLDTLSYIAYGLGMSLTELLDFPPYNQRPDGTSAAKQRDKWEQLGDALTPDEKDRVRRILTGEEE